MAKYVTHKGTNEAKRATLTRKEIMAMKYPKRDAKEMAKALRQVARDLDAVYVP